MSNFTILNTPKIEIKNERFVYNFFIDNEKDILDEKFILSEEESRLFALNTIDANQLAKPRYVTFDIDLREKLAYNARSLANHRSGLFANVPAVNRYFDLLENLGTSNNSLFDANMRIRHFNDIHSIKLGQVHDREFDLTISEDISELYNQMTRFLDEEESSDVIPSSNINYINFSNKSLYQTDTEDVTYSNVKKRLKAGTFNVVNGDLFERIKSSNRKNEWTFLEDKQEESFYNYNTYYREGLDSLEIRVPLEENALDAESSFEQGERRSRFYISSLFDNSPDVMVQTSNFVDELDPFGDFFEINEYVVGVLIDKFEVINSNNVLDQRKYKCSKFIRLDNVSEMLTITDDAINYGKTYIYETRPVLLQSFAGQESGPIRNYYLLLGNRITSYGIKCVERESPNPPGYLELNYDNNNKGIKLRWCLPRNRQRDICNFQIFKRESPFEPFTLIKEIRRRNISSLDGSLDNFENVSEDIIERHDYFKFSYIDKDIQNNKIYIYAVCCIDAHGLSSSYSTQVAGKFNSLTSRLDVDTISLAGALKQYPNQFFPRKTKFFNFENDVISNTPIVKNKNKMNIYFTPDYQNILNNSTTQIINVNESEEIENYFSVSLTNINTLKTAKQNIYIQDRES